MTGARATWLCFVGLALALAAGRAFAAGPYEMKFQFDHKGTPSLHSFLLHWDAPDGNLQYVEVLISDTQEVIQKIAIPQEGVKLIYKELAEGTDRIKEKFIDSLDYDFDKYGDLRILKSWPYVAGDKYYMVWIFDEDKNEYVLNAEVSALPGPLPNPTTQRIEAVTLGGWGGGEFVERSYSINASGRIRVQARIEQKILDGQRLTFTRDVRIRINGELQRICKLIVPAEGRIKRTWGNRELCKKYQTKETPKR